MNGSNGAAYVAAVSEMISGSLTPEQIETELPYARGLQLLIRWHGRHGTACYPASSSSTVAPSGFLAAMGMCHP
ncbi:MAG: hypothetical protein IPK72_22030 [Candidatus Eisenbacteria bacterium]|nr:hypothetical protein [Candidatus Eisenbacteria bacterium]